MHAPRETVWIKSAISLDDMGYYNSGLDMFDS